MTEEEQKKKDKYRWVDIIVGIAILLILIYFFFIYFKNVDFVSWLSFDNYETKGEAVKQMGLFMATMVAFGLMFEFALDFFKPRHKLKKENK